MYRVFIHISTQTKCQLEQSSLQEGDTNDLHPIPTSRSQPCTAAVYTQMSDLSPCSQMEAVGLMQIQPWWTGLLGIWCQGTRTGNSGMEHILFLDSIEETSGNKCLK